MRRDIVIRRLRFLQPLNRSLVSIARTANKLERATGALAERVDGIRCGNPLEFEGETVVSATEGPNPLTHRICVVRKLPRLLTRTTRSNERYPA